MNKLGISLIWVPSYYRHMHAHKVKWIYWIFWVNKYDQGPLAFLKLLLLVRSFEALVLLLLELVAEPPELSRLKCAGHHHKGNTDSNALQTEQFLVCRVTSRYNHRFPDRTRIPRTKASPEILQPQFYNTGIVKITNQFKRLLQNQLK